MALFLKIIAVSSILLFYGCDTSETTKQKSRSKDQAHINKETPSEATSNSRMLSQQFKEYWFSGTAELTSYQLSIERYGELREGTAMTIFVTEDFLPNIQVKANRSNDTTMPVLKVNKTKNFLTGIYPYSIMSSTFSPLTQEQHAIKISTSVQEWCGQTYMQLNNRDQYEIITHSYFEGEADQEKTLPKTWLENEFWNRIRINPEELPTGDITVIPAFDFTRMYHKELKAYKAFAALRQGDSITNFTINYSELQRQLSISFNNKFPYEIERWEETNGINPNDTTRLKTTAIKMKRIKTPYWQQNSNKDIVLRDSLNLKS
ncbi:septum formation inhibitor Maf [Cochleicola gelatinilyticus]|uniref:Septum formation inhibitor Maf n=1 Tax=Cochleicola gelatinilyticus TaxID=1763537 RepID=A0A167HSU7_9FLAO|nr:septum formation inhibitor Maf [Cochleicola gelatinilyticus]OAB78928.1 septum formation inhibitor Maf [Cochleicola gelatinilyticus]